MLCSTSNLLHAGSSISTDREQRTDDKLADFSYNSVDTTSFPQQRQAWRWRVNKTYLHSLAVLTLPRLFVSFMQYDKASVSSLGLSSPWHPRGWENLLYVNRLVPMRQLPIPTTLVLVNQPISLFLVPMARVERTRYFKEQFPPSNLFNKLLVSLRYPASTV